MKKTLLVLLICLGNYSHEDVKQLLEFYDSELGQKLLDTQSKLTVKSLQMGQELGTKLMPLVHKHSN